MRRNRQIAVWLGCIALTGGFVAACGDDGGDSGSSGSSSGGETGTTEGAKVIDPKSMEGAKGDITYCQGKDTPGDAKASIEGFNKKYSSQGITAKLVEFPADAQQQRKQFVQRQEAKSGECDVFSADVVWTAEFANQKWLYDMTPYIDAAQGRLHPRDARHRHVRRQVLGRAGHVGLGASSTTTPMTSSEVPATWQEVYDDAAKKDGIVYQGAAYEGLTCAFLEIAFAAGGKVLSDDGKKAEFDSPENVEALTFMVDGIKNGAAPKAVTTYMEEQARRAFEAGNATYMRNWPYAYAVGKKNKNAPEFEVAAFPSSRAAARPASSAGTTT